jgi:hypothetical protein
VVAAELVLDLPNKEVAPLNEHVLGHRLMVRVLDLADISELSWQF